MQFPEPKGTIKSSELERENGGVDLVFRHREVQDPKQHGSSNRCKDREDRLNETPADRFGKTKTEKAGKNQ